MRTASTTLALALLACLAHTPYVSAEIQWQPNLKKAHAEAKKEGKLMLLHFVRDRCLYCDKLEEGAFKDAEVGNTIDQHFAAVKINVSDSRLNRRIAERFRIDRFPMDVVVTPDGEALAHGVSPQAPEAYVAMLTKTLPPAATPAATAPPTQIAAAQAPQGSSSQSTLPVQVAASAVSAPQTGMALPAGLAPAAAATTTPPAVTPPPPTELFAARTPAIPQPTTSQAATISQAAPVPSGPQQPVVAQTVSARISKTPLQKTAPNQPELAMEGFCAVTVVDETRWVEGKPDFGVIHLGKLYLFNDKAAMEKFLSNPTPYTPVLNAIDVVRFFEERMIVPGKREWAMQDPDHNRMFFFADEAAMLHFEHEYARYVDAAIKVMDKAVKESNPGS